LTLDNDWSKRRASTCVRIRDDDEVLTVQNLAYQLESRGTDWVNGDPIRQSTYLIKLNNKIIDKFHAFHTVKHYLIAKGNKLEGLPLPFDEYNLRKKQELAEYTLLFAGC